MNEARTGFVRLRAGACVRRFAAAAALALTLAACSTANIKSVDALPTPQPEKTTLLSASEQREHLRILAAYGGVYQNQRVQDMLEKTVDKLVAASERPEQKYQVTMLNSPAVNAFALPNGQLYVTRGLVALANDTSELASVLSHEMAHVIARHAAIREDQARQAALVNRVATDLLSDPQLGALALAKSKIALANFSRAQEFEADGIGVGISARAGYDPYGAERFLTSMGMNAHLKVARASIDPRAPDFLSSHPATPERVTNAVANARQYTGPGNGQRDRNAYLQLLEGLVYGEDPSEGFVRGRKFLHPKLGFTFTAPDGFTLDNTAHAVFGVKDGGSQALRLDVVRVAAEQTLPEYLTSGWIENIDPKTIEEIDRRRLPRRDRDRVGRPVDVPALPRALRQRGLSHHLRRQEPHRRGGQELPRVARHLPPHERVGDTIGAAATAEARRGQAGRHGREARPPHGRPRPGGRALPRAERARREGPGEARRSCEDRGGITQAPVRL